MENVSINHVFAACFQSRHDPRFGNKDTVDGYLQFGSDLRWFGTVNCNALEGLPSRRAEFNFNLLEQSCENMLIVLTIPLLAQLAIFRLQLVERFLKRSFTCRDGM